MFRCCYAARYRQSQHREWEHVACVGACGPVYRALDSRSKSLGFDSQCWPCVDVSGKVRIPHCLSPPSRNAYLVHRSKVGSIVAGCIGAHLARGKVKSVEHALSWSLDSKQLPLPLPLEYKCMSLLICIQCSVDFCTDFFPAIDMWYSKESID